MKKLLSIILIAPFLNSCNASEADDVICQGFGAADINIYVRDSLTETIVDTALVQLYIEDDRSTILNADYITDNDNLINTMEAAYYSTLDINELSFEYGIVVTESNYNSYVSKNIEFTLDTSCGANNAVVTTVYLCELGSTCL